jgi:hypothetical protein
MRVARLLLPFVVSALFLNSSAAQQTASSSTEASQLLRQSLAALQGNTSLTDVTLSGTARRIAGSDDDTGTGVSKDWLLALAAPISACPRVSALKFRISLEPN